MLSHTEEGSDKDPACIGHCLVYHVLSISQFDSLMNTKSRGRARVKDAKPRNQSAILDSLGVFKCLTY